MEEAHPVPQNVTSFQFHLVGDMTIKQFLYLAAGLATAYLLFIFLFPTSPILALPLIVLSACLGAAFAFLPIQDRPLDHWLKAYINAILSPTQRYWISPKTPNQKTEPSDPVFRDKLQLFLNNLPNLAQLRPVNQSSVMSSENPKSGLYPSLPQTKPNGPLTRLNLSPNPNINPQAPSSVQPQEYLPTAEELKKLVEQAKQSQILQVKIIDLEKQITQLKSAAAQSPLPKSTYTPQIDQMSQNLQTLLTQTSNIPTPQSEIVHKAATPTKTPKVVTVAPPKPEKTQPQLTSFPNVVNGIISDPRGNYLEGVIVIIHNKDNLPVRALKTNKLGQFTGATPLPDGIYTITLEKDNFIFDTLQVTLNGEIMAPIQVLAK